MDTYKNQVKMGKILFTLIISLSISLHIVNGQISIRKDIDMATSLTDFDIEKPIPYDSLETFRRRYPISKYTEYVGQQLYFIPLSKKFDFEKNNVKGKIKIEYFTTPEATKVEGAVIFENGQKKRIKKEETYIYKPYRNSSGQIETKRDEVEGKFFTITKVQIRTSVFPDEYQDITPKSERVRYSSFNLRFQLVREDNGDILYLNMVDDSLDKLPFMLMANYEKYKYMYESKELVAVKDVSSSNELSLIDINSGEKVEMKPGDYWTCLEVSLFDLNDHYILVPRLLLTNDKGNKLLFPFSKEFRSCFITADEFEAELAEKERQEKIRMEEMEKLTLQEEKAKEELKKEYIRKYGKEKGTLVSEGKVRIGMTKAMCFDAWGTPQKINTTRTANTVREQWVYDLRSYLYFENGILTTIQN